VTARKYSSPEAFKQALEQRLRAAVETGGQLARQRQLVVFERFLARILAVFGEAVTLKGGLVMELRLERARTTNDVDLRLSGAPDSALLKLQQAGRLNLLDFMTFEVMPDTDHPAIQNDGMQYEGERYRAECKLAGKLYGQRFGLDVAFGDPMHGAPELVVAKDALAFAGIAPPTLRIYPIETHLAEKLHAYTMPRPRPNTRVKDLPDMALLATTRALDAKQLRAAFEQTFDFRETHPLPTMLPDPLPAWGKPYEAMAREDRLLWPTLSDVTQAVRLFLDPVLVAPFDATWQPQHWSWRLR
jgi:predicted nucleotidyltransferase component of viral defense system